MNREELLKFFPELKNPEYHNGSFVTDRVGELDRLWQKHLKNLTTFKLDCKNFVSLSATASIRLMKAPLVFDDFQVQFKHSCRGYAKSTLMKISYQDWSEFDYIDNVVATFKQLNLTPEYWTPLIGNYAKE